MRKRRLHKKQTRKNLKRISWIKKRLSWRLGFFLLILLGGMWAYSTLSQPSFRGKLLAQTEKWGFVLKDIYVEGRTYLPRAKLLALTGLRKEQSLFSCDPHEIKKNIESMKWVKSAAVRRIFPNKIYIRLHERKPLALWQFQRKLHLIDEDGHTIPTKNLHPFQDILVIVGENAPQKAQGLIRVLKDFPSIKKQVTTAVLISNRRWDLMLNNKIKIRLPEKDIFDAFVHLQELINRNMLAEGKVLAIDLRLKDRSFFYMLPTHKKSINYKNT